MKLLGTQLCDCMPIIVCFKICNKHFILQVKYFTAKHKFHRTLHIDLVTYNFPNYLLLFCLETE